jgi:hypothetical protein
VANRGSVKSQRGPGRRCIRQWGMGNGRAYQTTPSHARADGRDAPKGSFGAIFSPRSSSPLAHRPMLDRRARRTTMFETTPWASPLESAWNSCRNMIDLLRRNVRRSGDELRRKQGGCRQRARVEGGTDAGSRARSTRACRPRSTDLSRAWCRRPWDCKPSHFLPAGRLASAGRLYFSATHPSRVLRSSSRRLPPIADAPGKEGTGWRRRESCRVSPVRAWISSTGSRCMTAWWTSRLAPTCAAMGADDRLRHPLSTAPDTHVA